VDVACLLALFWCQQTAGDRREPQICFHRITVGYLGEGHMAAAASAGSANPRYLEHGWKRVMAWRSSHDKGNQTLEDFFPLGLSKLICGHFWVHGQGSQVYTPPSRGLTRSSGCRWRCFRSLQRRSLSLTHHRCVEGNGNPNTTTIRYCILTAESTNHSQSRE
jgi:hypothetical protein